MGSPYKACMDIMSFFFTCVAVGVCDSGVALEAGHAIAVTLQT